MIFVLFAHGPEFFSKQAYLAARSITVRDPAARVVIYTTHPFAAADMDIRPISLFELQAWGGPLSFNHRQKVGMLIRAHLELGDQTPFCYLDSDMYCRGIPDEIADPGGTALFYQKEGPIGEHFHPRLHAFLRQQRPLLESAGYGALSPNLTMYNCGLICIPAGPQRLRIFEEVIRLTDFLCLRFPRQMTWLEQTAFSHLVPLHHEVETPSPGFDHYWGCNSEVARQLASLSLAEIDAIAGAEERFADLLQRAQAMQRKGDNKLRQTIRKWKGSIRKRVATYRALKLVGTS